MSQVLRESNQAHGLSRYEHSALLGHMLVTSFCPDVMKDHPLGPLYNWTGRAVRLSGYRQLSYD
jgi:hypothetical protein